MNLTVSYKLYLTDKQKEILKNTFIELNEIWINILKSKKNYLKKKEYILINEYVYATLIKELRCSNSKSEYIKQKRTIPIPVKNIKIEKGSLEVYGLGKVKVRPALEIDKIILCKITKSKSDEYYILFVVNRKIVNMQKTRKAIGIDMGINYFCILSSGVKINNPNFYRKEEKRIRHLQKIRSKKCYNSKGYKKLSIKINKIYESIKNNEINFLHQLSKKIISSYDIICIENLNVTEMIKSSCCKKSLNYICWKKFIGMLKYKAKLYNKKVIEVGQYFKSTKICNYCGYENKIDSLDIREYHCANCNKYLDRDINAAKNILVGGLKISKVKVIKL